MRKLFLFVKAVASDWVGQMSGIVGLALGFAAKFWSNDRIPDLWLWTACVCCLVFAFFRAWAREFDRAELAEVTGRGVSKPAVMRVLSSDQRKLIMQRLAPVVARAKQANGYGIQIVVHPLDGWDCFEYANQFVELFSVLNFRFGDWRFEPSGLKKRSEYFHGLYIRWNSAWAKNAYPAVGDELATALLEAGIHVEVVDDPDSITLELIVGAQVPYAA